MIGGMQGHSQGDAAWHREQLGHALSHEEHIDKLETRLSEMQQTLIDHGEIQKSLCEQIEKLTKQRDELLAVIEAAYKTASEHDDTLPFDWAVHCEMLYQAIASVKED